MKTLTLEQLATELNGKIWTKGEMKRVYIERGYNTKKMSTKTYIHEVNGQFEVKVYIECPSQDYNWIKSQQDQIIESVENQIELIEIKEELKNKTPFEQKKLLIEKRKYATSEYMNEQLFEMIEYYDEICKQLNQ